MRNFLEVKSEIAKWEKLFDDKDCLFSEKVWIELQLKELRKELKQINKLKNVADANTRRNRT